LRVTWPQQFKNGGSGAIGEATQGVLGLEAPREN